MASRALAAAENGRLDQTQSNIEVLYREWGMVAEQELESVFQVFEVAGAASRSCTGSVSLTRQFLWLALPARRRRPRDPDGFAAGSDSGFSC
eukprot:9493218-Pyramimonas_sp.AAC.1